jgi:hypothetical protein
MCRRKDEFFQGRKMTNDRVFKNKKKILEKESLKA